MLFTAQLEPGPVQADHRFSARKAIKLRVPADTPTGKGVPVLVHDLSLFGILIESQQADITVGAILDVELPRVGSRSASVIWKRNGFIGCEFHKPLTNAGLSAALLRSHAGLEAKRLTAPDLRSAFREPDVEELPLRTRVAVILTSAVVCWALCLAAIIVIFA